MLLVPSRNPPRALGQLSYPHNCRFGDRCHRRIQPLWSRLCSFPGSPPQPISRLATLRGLVDPAIAGHQKQFVKTHRRGEHACDAPRCDHVSWLFCVEKDRSNRIQGCLRRHFGLSSLGGLGAYPRRPWWFWCGIRPRKWRAYEMMRIHKSSNLPYFNADAIGYGFSKRLHSDCSSSVQDMRTDGEIGRAHLGESPVQTSQRQQALAEISARAQSEAVPVESLCEANKCRPHKLPRVLQKILQKMLSASGLRRP